MNEKQLEIKNRVISLLSDQDLQEYSLLKEIEKLSESANTDGFSAELLNFFVHATFGEDEAERHWAEIFKNYDYYLHELKRNVGLRVAIFDYFVNLNKVVASPIMVEIHVFKEAEKMAMLDSLTGIFNRRYFDINLRKELKRALRYGKDLSLLMVDLDNFKHINDSKGHQFGDEVLKGLAGILTNISREEDIPCRYGGEEFIVILPETNTKGALVFSERLRTEMKSTAFFLDHNITFSGGITSYPEAGEDPVTLLENADRALYKAKFSGKDKSIVWSEPES